MAIKRKKIKFVKRKTITRKSAAGAKPKLALFLLLLAAAVLFGRVLYLQKPFLAGKQTAKNSGKSGAIFKPETAPLPSLKKDAFESLKLQSKEIKTDINKIDAAGKIEAKNPLCYIKKENQIFGIDGGGNIFLLPQNANLKNIPALIYAADADIKTTAQFIENLKKNDPAFFEDISQIKIAAASGMVLTLKNKTEIFWGAAEIENIKTKNAVLKKVLLDAEKKNGKIDYIDMTLYNYGRVIAKPVNVKINKNER